jgi:hypothetical protein
MRRTPGRKKSFDIRKVMRAVMDQDHLPLRVVRHARCGDRSGLGCPSRWLSSLPDRYRISADQFRAELTERMKKFQLELHPEKTRLLEFGPFAINNRKGGEKGSRRRSTFSALRTSA